MELGLYTMTKKIDVGKEEISLQTLEMILSDLSRIVKMNKFEPTCDYRMGDYINPHVFLSQKR